MFASTEIQPSMEMIGKAKTKKHPTEQANIPFSLFTICTFLTQHYIANAFELQVRREGKCRDRFK